MRPSLITRISVDFALCALSLLLLLPKANYAQSKRSKLSLPNSHLCKTSVETGLESVSTYLIARVLSLEPFLIEVLASGYKDEKDLYSLHPFSSYKFEPNDIQGLQYGDIITGCSYAYFYDAGELALGTGIRNIRRLGISAKKRFSGDGFLIYYKPVHNAPNSYLIIYKNGMVFANDIPGEYIPPKKLTARTVMEWERKVRAVGERSEESIDLAKGYLATSETFFKQFHLPNSSTELLQFTALLDSLVAGYIKDVTYRISYSRRVPIKDWTFGNIFPLDQAASEVLGSYNGKYLTENFERLSKLKPPPEFFSQAEDYGRGKDFFFRYKGKLYAFSFPTCTAWPTGTWACYRANELPYGRLAGGYFGYIDWPKKLQIKLTNVPKDGLDIPKSEFNRNQAFYNNMFSKGSNYSYREGNYIYQGVQIHYH